MRAGHYREYDRQDKANGQYAVEQVADHGSSLSEAFGHSVFPLGLTDLDISSLAPKRSRKNGENP